MSFRAVLPLAFALLLTAPGPAGAAAPLEGAALSAYIDSVVDAYGGAKAIAKLKTHRIEGEVDAHMRGDKGEFVRDSSAPTSLRVELKYPTRTEIRILAGAKGWRGNADSQKAVTGMPHTAMIYQMIRSSAPWFIHDCRKRLTHHTTTTNKAGTSVALRLEWSKSLKIDFWIDDDTRRVVKVQGTLLAHGATMTFETQYSDFREVDGLLVAHTEKSIVRGNHTGTTTIKRVTFGAKKLGPFAP